MVSALVSGPRGPGSSPGRGHCVVFLGIACEQAPCEGRKKFGERSVNPAAKRVGVRA